MMNLAIYACKCDVPKKMLREDMKKVFDYSMRAYLKSVVVPLAAITILLPIVPYLISAFMETSFSRLFSICIVDVVLAFSLMWGIVLNSKEQILVKEYIHKRILKRNA